MILIPAGGVESGLDLSRYKALEEEQDREASESGSDKRDGDDKTENLEDRKSPEGGSRSRRKPAAPQWVNPGMLPG